MSHHVDQTAAGLSDPQRDGVSVSYQVGVDGGWQGGSPTFLRIAEH